MIGYKVPPVFASNDTRRIIQTFTRPSDAYLDGTLYGPDVARFPSNSGIKGAKVEEGTTNLLSANQASVETDTTGFTGNRSTETLARDTSTFWQGAASLSVTTPGGQSGEGVRLSTVTVVNGQTYTFSVWVKGSGTINLGMSDAVTQTGSSSLALTGQWQRLSVTKTVASTTAICSVTISGTAAVTFWVDGLQLENKAYATEWQLPGTARAAETLTVPTAGLLAPSAGSVIIRQYVDGDLAVTSSASKHYMFDCGNAGDNKNRIAMYRIGGSWSVEARDSAGTASATSWSPGATPVGWHSFGYRYSAANLALFYDGLLKTQANNPANMPTSLVAQANIGTVAGGQFAVNQPIAYAIFYGRALSDAEMAAATLGNPPADYTAYLDYTGGALRSAPRILNRNFNPDLIAPAGNTFG